MPNYDYECQDCGYRFEVFQSMNDQKLTECPKCDGPVERLIGAGAGMIFKGSGFYITDYRSDSYKKGQKADSKSGSKSSDSGTKGKSDKKSSTSKGSTSKSD